MGRNRKKPIERDSSGRQGHRDTKKAKHLQRAVEHIVDQARVKSSKENGRKTLREIQHKLRDRDKTRDT